MFSISKKYYIRTLIVGMLILIPVLWYRSLKSDLGLVDLIPKTQRDWEFGQINAVRDVGRDIWDVTAQRGVRRSGQEFLYEISSEITGPSGYRAFTSSEGIYDHNENTLLLKDVDGEWKRDVHPLRWKTVESLWQQEGDVWNFPRGITIIGDTYSLDGEEATMAEQRKVWVKNGCLQWWTE